jgi:hypothetical protein
VILNMRTTQLRLHYATQRNLEPISSEVVMTSNDKRDPSRDDHGRHVVGPAAAQRETRVASREAACGRS